MADHVRRQKLDLFAGAARSVKGLAIYEEDPRVIPEDALPAVSLMPVSETVEEDETHQDSGGLIRQERRLSVRLVVLTADAQSRDVISRDLEAAVSAALGFRQIRLGSVEFGQRVEGGRAHIASMNYALDYHCMSNTPDVEI